MGRVLNGQRHLFQERKIRSMTADPALSRVNSMRSQANVAYT
jgi:hypothetical protein